jgi:hypothetical protein
VLKGIIEYHSTGRESMSRRNNTSLIEDLIFAPWWVNLIVLITGNIFIRFFIPLWFSGERVQGSTGKILSGGIANAMPGIANLFSMAICFTLVISTGRALLEALRKSKPKETAYKVETLEKTEAQERDKPQGEKWF